MPTLVAIKPLSKNFFFHGPRLSHVLTEKSTGPIRQIWT